jgi:hypothetical protein
MGSGPPFGCRNSPGTSAKDLSNSEHGTASPDKGMMMQRGVAILSALVATATCTCRRSSRDETTAPVAATKPVTKPAPAPRADVVAPPGSDTEHPGADLRRHLGQHGGLLLESPTRNRRLADQAVHGEIDTAISKSGLGTARKCTVGDDVTCDRPELRLADRATIARRRRGSTRS